MQRLLERTSRTATALAMLVVLGAGPAWSSPIVAKEGVLPPGTELNEDPLDQPTELFGFEMAGGKRSYLFNLGDMLFSSAGIFGGPAQKAGISCNTCHQQGAGNAKLYVPGLSSRPGNFDTSGALFNPKADNGLFDPVTPPSLRGAKYLGPYGHDGRMASLRDFVRNVIVNEFAGPEPSPQVLDALVTYIDEIAFLPNPKLAAGGYLSAQASEAARRGETVFNRPFPHDASMSCASCHQPSSAFIDHKVHDIGSGGWFKTKTLLNANFNAPYFHDGRFDSYEQVVGYFDRHYDLGYSEGERADLVAYLNTVGDGEEPYTRNTLALELDELKKFVSVLDTAIPARDREVIALTVDAVGGEWRELAEFFPGAKDTSVAGGLAERRRARAAAGGMALTLRRIAMAAADNNFAEVEQAYSDYRAQATVAVVELKKAEPWSLFNPAVRDAHFQALAQLDAMAGVAGGLKSR
ncbi:MAG TPA: cytochrome c peroxidase [Pseudolabrys sp.]|nr:cytochrome c peroxidase [Pseudolabrys sp.]